MIFTTIRTSYLSKVISVYLTLMLVMELTYPLAAYALTGGPSQPEFNSFTPIDTSDMVNVSSGDFSYNIPLMDVGGYPINMSYQSGITMDQEASSIGLGWNLNVGQIKRQVRGLPDDFKGEKVTYEDNIKKRTNVSVTAGLDVQVFGIELPDELPKPTAGLSLGVDYNNYTGVGIRIGAGMTMTIADGVTVGVQAEASAVDGVTLSPSIGLSGALGGGWLQATGGINAGLSYNSSRGLEGFNMSASVGVASQHKGKVNADPAKRTNKEKYQNAVNKATGGRGSQSLGGSSSISFQNTKLARVRTPLYTESGTFTVSVGGHVYGVDAEAEISAAFSKQYLKEKHREIAAFGYENSHLATEANLLDFSRENDRPVSKKTTILPTVNYTYDLYSINGQGVSGMFRPFRSQVGKVGDVKIVDSSEGKSLGIEVEAGAGFHIGKNYVKSTSENYSGYWNTEASNNFSYLKNNNGQTLDYQPVYFNYVGANNVDTDEDFANKFKNKNAVALGLKGSGFGKTLERTLVEKKLDGGLFTSIKNSFTGLFKRNKREEIVNVIQKITKEELKDFYPGDGFSYYNKRANNHAKPYHTAEIRVLQGDGGTYVFGETAYNTEKQEVSFAVRRTSDGDEVEYDPNNPNDLGNPTGENSIANKSGIDNFYSRIITPEYAHTYLLSAIYSKDYEDRTLNGPTDDDFGSYTEFEYTIPQDYQWRVPFDENQASYNAGLNSHPDDQKASYMYGKKEIKYIKKITTKTHVAVFSYSERQDAKGVKDENGGIGNSSMLKVDKIALYAKRAYKKDKENAIPLKTTFFEYDYDLCKGIDNNNKNNSINRSLTSNEYSNNGGKLTLKKVYFTYGSSTLGSHTPYVFNYDTTNPNYSLKAYNIWGNYKPNTGAYDVNGETTAPEFPFVDQNNKIEEDKYVAAWSMSSIDLPSGGEIKVTYESDDYLSVQNKPAMEMFKLAGVGTSKDASDKNEISKKLYGNWPVEKSELGISKYLYVEIPNVFGDTSLLTEEQLNLEFRKKFLKNVLNKPLYFRVMLNITKKSKHYEYVTGYCNLDGANAAHVFEKNGKLYASLKTKLVKAKSRGGKMNPITNAGLFFARTYLKNLVFTGTNSYKDDDIASIARKLVGSLTSFTEILTGPNLKLILKKCAQKIKPQKSWIRLSSPRNYKLGGGIRVKKLESYDNWNTIEADEESNFYGQSYQYVNENGVSSGVATFEPNDSAENPWVEPVYFSDENSLQAPRQFNYVEKPLGKSFFPSASVTYGRVRISNLKREGIEKHATGALVKEFYTSKDFPTRTDYTKIQRHFKSNENDFLKNILKGILGKAIETKKQFTLSQGFVVETNDMDGKSKSEKVYQEGKDTPISSIEYLYAVDKQHPDKLNNNLKVINDGVEETREIGVDYDLISDFSEGYSKSKTAGRSHNLAVLPVPFPPFALPVPTSIPSSVTHYTIAHSAVLTKHVHRTGILEKVIKTDLGTKEITTNAAWDAKTGEVLVSKVTNEYDEEYYKVDFPAYWAYKGMGAASQNLGVEGVLGRPNAEGFFTIKNGAENYLTEGDELMANLNFVNQRLWVTEFNANKSGVRLMTRIGIVLSNDKILESIDEIPFKIVRSGYRNLLSEKIASITTLENPLAGEGEDFDGRGFEDTGVTDHKKVVNATAVVFDDFWNTQSESGLKSVPITNPDLGTVDKNRVFSSQLNPFVNNIKGEWRAKESYAYLSNRNTNRGISKTAKQSGFYEDFYPFYTHNKANHNWEISNIDKWTSASTVTQYNAYGNEIENKDALQRKSTAQYGYNYTLPTGVGSNISYRELGVDNFEDYEENSTYKGHFNFKDQLDFSEPRGVQLSSTNAHTGLYSLHVPESKIANKVTELGTLNAFIPNVDKDFDRVDDFEDNCPCQRNGHQKDKDGDGVGDICDDDYRVYLSVGVSGVRRIGCRLYEKSLKIAGKPNDKVEFDFYKTAWGTEADEVNAVIYVNGREILSTGKGFYYTNGNLLYLDEKGKAEIAVRYYVPARTRNSHKRRWRRRHWHYNNRNGIKGSLYIKDKRTGRGVSYFRFGAESDLGCHYTAY